MKYITTKITRIALTCFIVSIAAIGVSGCGGGDSEIVKPAGITYTVFAEDRIGSGSLTFDIDGGLKVDNTTFTLSTSSSAQCSLTSSPASPPDPPCNTLVGGAAFLLCDDAIGENFSAVLFTNGVVSAEVAELRGLTLKAVSCGPTALRETGTTLAVNGADDSFLQTLPGGSTFLWTYPYMEQLLSSIGALYIDWRYRFVVQKVVQADKTTYILLELFEKTSTGSTVRPPRIYVVDAPAKGT